MLRYLVLSVGFLITCLASSSSGEEPCEDSQQQTKETVSAFGNTAAESPQPRWPAVDDHLKRLGLEAWDPTSEEPRLRLVMANIHRTLIITGSLESHRAVWQVDLYDFERDRLFGSFQRDLAFPKIGHIQEMVKSLQPEHLMQRDQDVLRGSTMDGVIWELRYFWDGELHELRRKNLFLTPPYELCHWETVDLPGYVEDLKFASLITYIFSVVSHGQMVPWENSLRDAERYVEGQGVPIKGLEQE